MTQHLPHQGPSIATHIASTAELPPEPTEDVDDRPDEPTPSLWQKSVKVKHRVSGREAIVVRVDWAMNMARLFYPDERDNTTGKMGRFSTRREWEQCSEWIVETTYSPAELNRRAAAKQMEDAILALDAEDAAYVALFCDDADPNKNFAKMQALMKIGVIKSPPPAPSATEPKGKTK